MPNGHPPIPGPMVQPNYLPVEEALAHVTFPISKKDLLAQVGDTTVLFDGRNVDLQEMVAQLHDDFFDSEEELHAALEVAFPVPEDERESVPLAPGERAEAKWNAPEPAGGERGVADTQESMDTEP